MAHGEIDGLKFAGLLLSEFPELREDVHEWHDLLHLQMMELQLLTERSIKAGDWNTVEKCLGFADTVFRDGNPEIRNAICVSYLESLPREGANHDRLRTAMTFELRQAWDRILDYLSSLRDNS